MKAYSVRLFGHLLVDVHNVAGEDIPAICFTAAAMAGNPDDADRSRPFLVRRGLWRERTDFHFGSEFETAIVRTSTYPEGVDYDLVKRDFMPYQNATAYAEALEKLPDLETEYKKLIASLTEEQKLALQIFGK